MERLQHPVAENLCGPPKSDWCYILILSHSQHSYMEATSTLTQPNHLLTHLLNLFRREICLLWLPWENLAISRPRRR